MKNGLAMVLCGINVSTFSLSVITQCYAFAFSIDAWSNQNLNSVGNLILGHSYDSRTRVFTQVKSWDWETS